MTSPELSSDISFQLHERAQALQPYLVTKAERGVVGTSRYAVSLRRQIQEATASRCPVSIFGEPGLDKDNIAALIHFSSPSCRESIIKVNCSLLQPNGAELFGRADGKPGLLTWLGQGTLVLNNIQELPPALIPQIIQLLEHNTFQPIGSEETATPLVSQVRVLMVAEKRQPATECHVGHLIEVPALRVRKADISPQVKYYVSLFCRDRGIPKPTLTPTALRSLQSYDFKVMTFPATSKNYNYWWNGQSFNLLEHRF